MTDLVASVALVTFPNSALADPPRRNSASVAPAAVRRATAFMEANAQDPITLSDIAEASRVSPRTLQNGFRRHLDTSPTAHLRRVRLDHARRELRDADPTTGITVARIARRWGFANAGSFAGRYRAAFGEAPSETLRR